jgi:methionyl-tRNA formyltransferase
MKILLLTNKSHKVALEAIKFLELKKINFKCIDTKVHNKIKISQKFDYLLSFLNPLFIKKDLRKKIKKMAINFHPGPPEYPGYGCYNFALLDCINSYGCTAHLMNDKIDNGKIIDVKRFEFKYDNINLEKLIKLTHKNSFLLFKKIIFQIIEKDFVKLENKEKWKKKKPYTKIQFEKARNVNLNDTKENILKKIKAFSYKNYKSVYLQIKGKKYEIR